MFSRISSLISHYQDKRKTGSALDRIREDAAKFRTKDFALFRAELAHSNTYAEYGIGASTVFACGYENLAIRAVETDPDWVDAVGEIVGDRAQIIHADLGPVSGLGRPLSYDRATHFKDYTYGIFSKGFSPDLILIDGRFRVACFLASLLEASVGTRIILDDYQRARYQVVEEIVSPVDRTSRQALFVKPSTLDVEKARSLFEKFEFVMD